MRLLGPRIHGYIDVAMILVFVLAPFVVGLGGPPALISWGLALVFLILTLATRYPLGAAKQIPFVAHGIVELVIAVFLANPSLPCPMVNPVFAGGGPTFPWGGIFPFVFICIMCGAISGFHSLVASGTTPKMIDREPDARMIGYGSMLMESLVGITALVAATALPPADYFAINTDPPVPIVAKAEGGPGLAQSDVQLQSALAAFGDADLRRLGLARDAAPAAGATAKLSDVLHLSNSALAALGFHADPRDAHASELSPSARCAHERAEKEMHGAASDRSPPPSGAADDAAASGPVQTTVR